MFFTKTFIQIHHFLDAFNPFITRIFKGLDGFFTALLAPPAKICPGTHLPVLSAKALSDGRAERKGKIKSNAWNF
jgi:hypothetical protein